MSVWSGEGLAILGLIAAVVFFLGTIIFQVKLGKPKLVAVGSSVTRTDIQRNAIMVASINFYNAPTVLGLRVSRGDALIKSARLYDTMTEKLVGPSLQWQKAHGPGSQGTATIEAGAERTLHVFVKESGNAEFFLYQVIANKDMPYDPQWVWMDRRKEFAIQLFDNIGRKYRFGIVITNTLPTIRIRIKLTLYHRLSLLRKAGRELRLALPPLREAWGAVRKAGHELRAASPPLRNACGAVREACGWLLRALFSRG